MTDNKLIRIYCYKEKSTGIPKYVGQTTRLIERRAGGSKGYFYLRTKYFGPAIQKYGFDSFEPEILTTTTDREYANLLEWFYTIEFNTQYPSGYNDSIGRKRSEDFKYAMKFKPHGGNHLGNHSSRSEEWKKRVSKKQKENIKSLTDAYYNNNPLNLKWNQFQKYMKEKITN